MKRCPHCNTELVFIEVDIEPDELEHRRSSVRVGPTRLRHHREVPALATVTLHDTEAVQLHIAFTDAQGQPTSPDTPPTWSSDAAAVADVRTAGDGTTWVVAATPGTANVTATTVDNDGTTVTATIEVDVIAGEATTGVITADTPVPATQVPA